MTDDLNLVTKEKVLTYIHKQNTKAQSINSLPHEMILDWSKSKSFAKTK